MIRMLSAADKLAEIKRLYYQTTRATIKEDFAKAIDLLKSMPSEEERERVAVYMDGLSQMRSDWARQGRIRKRKTEKEKRIEIANARARRELRDTRDSIRSSLLVLRYASPVSAQSRPELIDTSRIQHVLSRQPGASRHVHTPSQRPNAAFAVRIGADHDFHTAIVRGLRVDV